MLKAKTPGAKPRLQLFEEILSALNEAVPERVLILIDEITSEDLTLQLLTTKRLRLRPLEKEKAWDDTQKAFFTFILRIAARKDTDTLLKLHKLLEADRDFLGDPDLKRALNVSISEVLTPKLFPNDIPRELIFRVLRNCPPSNRKNCFAALADAFSELLKILEERRYEYLVASDVQKELERRQRQISEDLLRYSRNVRAEDLAKIIGYISQIQYILSGIEAAPNEGRQRVSEKISNANGLIKALFRQFNVHALGTEEESVTFDPNMHESTQPMKAGEHAVIKRPGLAVHTEHGELGYVIRKALVQAR